MSRRAFSCFASGAPIRLQLRVHQRSVSASCGSTASLDFRLLRSCPACPRIPGDHSTRPPRVVVPSEGLERWMRKSGHSITHPARPLSRSAIGWCNCHLRMKRGTDEPSPPRPRGRKPCDLRAGQSRGATGRYGLSVPDFRVAAESWPYSVSGKSSSPHACSDRNRPPRGRPPGERERVLQSLLCGGSYIRGSCCPAAKAICGCFEMAQ